MGDSPIFNTIKNVAGYGVGTLAALTTIKSGGLGNYIMNRQRMLQDPNFRASLEGSPFASGFFGVSGSTGAAPALPSLPQTAAGGAVAQPQPGAQPGPWAGGYVLPEAGQQIAQPTPTPDNSANRMADQTPAPAEMPDTAANWMMMLLSGGALSGAGMLLRRRR